MTLSIDVFRQILGRLSSAPPAGEGGAAGMRMAAPITGDGGVAGSSGEEPAGRSHTGESPAPSRDGEGDQARRSRLGNLATAYLNARADEILGLLLEEMGKEASRALGRTLEESRQEMSGEIAEVREGVQTSQREISRFGRELLRSGATLESIHAAVSAIGPTIERLDALLRAELAQGNDRDRRLREEAESAALDDILSTLDGLEAGLDDGRGLVRELAETERRLKDATVQRWWRAMGEATGVKRPLPEVPRSDVEKWIDGLALTHRRLQDALARRGIMAIEAVGKPFDPHLHEAVAVEPSPEDQDGLVLRERRRGYRTADRVIRVSEVVVGRGEPCKASRKETRPHRASAATSIENGKNVEGDVGEANTRRLTDE